MGLILKGVVHSLTPGSERTVNMKDGSSFVSRKYKVLDVDAGKIFQVETIDHELDVEPSQTVSLPVFVTASKSKKDDRIFINYKYLRDQVA